MPLTCTTCFEEQSLTPRNTPAATGCLIQNIGVPRVVVVSVAPFAHTCGALTKPTKASAFGVRIEHALIFFLAVCGATTNISKSLSSQREKEHWFQHRYKRRLRGLAGRWCMSSAAHCTASYSCNSNSSAIRACSLLVPCSPQPDTSARSIQMAQMMKSVIWLMCSFIEGRAYS